MYKRNFMTYRCKLDSNITGIVIANYVHYKICSQEEDSEVWIWDDGFDASNVGQLEAHIMKDCSECREILRKATSTVELLNRLGRGEVAQGRATRLQELRDTIPEF